MGNYILIVEDEVMLASSMKMFLELNGYVVDMAHNGQDGLTAARAKKPNLIISDINMPIMDGFSMLKEIKMDMSLQDVTVVMLTAKEGLNDLCEIEGSAEFLVKPFDLDRLLAVVKKYVPPSPLT